MHRGDTFQFTLTVTQNNAAFNLTSATIRMTAKWRYDDADVDAVFTVSTSTSGIVITNAAGGLATVTLVPSKTSSLPANRVDLYYDIQVTDASNNVYTVTDGTLIVLPDVSVTTP